MVVVKGGREVTGGCSKWAAGGVMVICNSLCKKLLVNSNKNLDNDSPGA